MEIKEYIGFEQLLKKKKKPISAEQEELDHGKKPVQKEKNSKNNAGKK